MIDQHVKQLFSTIAKKLVQHSQQLPTDYKAVGDTNMIIVDLDESKDAQELYMWLKNMRTNEEHNPHKIPIKVLKTFRSSNKIRTRNTQAQMTSEVSELIQRIRAKLCLNFQLIPVRYQNVNGTNTIVVQLQDRIGHLPTIYGEVKKIGDNEEYNPHKIPIKIVKVKVSRAQSRMPSIKPFGLDVIYAPNDCPDANLEDNTPD
jgi:hypothetical protein